MVFRLCRFACTAAGKPAFAAHRNAFSERPISEISAKRMPRPLRRPAPLLGVLLLLSPSPLAAVGCGSAAPPPSAPPGNAPGGASAGAPATSTAATAPPENASSQTAAPAQAAASAPPSAPGAIAHVDVPPALTAVVAASDRSGADQKLDAGRHPAEMLAFFGVAPGMHIGEIAAGGGYTTELLARAVGPSGVVYAENPKLILVKFAEKPWSARLAKPVNKHVVRVDREPNDPFPPEAHDLDLVVDVLFYHDTVWLGVDREAMNAAIFKALKHGGVYGIVDHSAKAGAGLNDVKTLHRIEERSVEEEVERAGFRLDSMATFLANPSDGRDWNDSPSQAGDRRGTSDRFVLKFVKD
jgi:predicted methyltransferase